MLPSVLSSGPSISVATLPVVAVAMPTIFILPTGARVNMRNDIDGDLSKPQASIHGRLMLAYKSFADIRRLLGLEEFPGKTKPLARRLQRLLQENSYVLSYPKKAPKTSLNQ